MPGSATKPVISTGAMNSTACARAQPSSVSASSRLGTRWANGSPGATSPIEAEEQRPRDVAGAGIGDLHLAAPARRRSPWQSQTPSSIEHAPDARGDGRGALVLRHGEGAAVEQGDAQSLSSTRRQRQRHGEAHRAAADDHDVKAGVGHQCPPPCRLCRPLEPRRASGVVAAAWCCPNVSAPQSICANFGQDAEGRTWRRSPFADASGPTFLNRIIRLTIAAAVWHAT